LEVSETDIDCMSHHGPLVSAPGVFSVAPEGAPVRAKYNHADNCAAVLIVMGFVEIILGVLVRDIIVSSAGGWWAGMFCVFTGVLSLSSLCGAASLCDGNVLVMWMHSVSALSIILTFSSLIIDQSAYDVVTQIDGCLSDSGFFGAPGFDEDVPAVSFICHDQHPSFDCSCVDMDGWCSNYYMTHNYEDCSPIVDKRQLPHALSDSATCLWFLFLAVVGNSLLMCRYRGCCCNSSSSTTGAVLPVQTQAQVVMPNAPLGGNGQVQMGVLEPLHPNNANAQQAAAGAGFQGFAGYDPVYQNVSTNSSLFGGQIPNDPAGSSNQGAIPIQAIPVAKSVSR